MFAKQLFLENNFIEEINRHLVGNDFSKISHK